MARRWMNDEKQQPKSNLIFSPKGLNYKSCQNHAKYIPTGHLRFNKNEGDSGRGRVIIGSNMNDQTFRKELLFLSREKKKRSNEALVPKESWFGNDSIEPHLLVKTAFLIP